MEERRELCNYACESPLASCLTTPLKVTHEAEADLDLLNALCFLFNRTVNSGRLPCFAGLRVKIFSMTDLSAQHEDAMATEEFLKLQMANVL